MLQNKIRDSIFLNPGTLTVDLSFCHIASGHVMLLCWRMIDYVVCDGIQVLCTVIVITGLCDLVKTVVDLTGDSNDVPNYQIISPIVLLLSAVSVCVCVMCMCIRKCEYTSNQNF